MRLAGLFLSVVALLAFVSCGDQDPVSSVSEEGVTAPAGKLTISATKAGGYRGKRVQRSVYQAEMRALNAQDLDKHLAYMTNDVVYDGVPAPPPMQKEAYRAFLELYFQGFPDLLNNEQRILCAGNICVGEWIATGTHLGDFMGIPPTGNEVQNPNLIIVEFDGDKIKKIIHYLDMAAVMVQLGVMPAGDSPSLVPSFELPDPAPTGLSPMAAHAEFIARLNNTQDPAAIAEMMPRDGQISFAAFGMVPLDRDAFTAFNELFFQGFSDLQHRDVRRVNMGDGWVLWEGIVTGTHDGPYLGIPATDNSVVIRAASITRWDADGLLREGYVYSDGLTLLTQVGAIPAP
jgi:steroid delta-isomerase-like uncharacterized protein